MILKDGYDFGNKKPLKKPSTDGYYLVTEVTPIIHNKFLYKKEKLEGSTYTVPSWETKESLEITIVEIHNYVRES